MQVSVYRNEKKCVFLAICMCQVANQTTEEVWACVITFLDMHWLHWKPRKLANNRHQMMAGGF